MLVDLKIINTSARLKVLSVEPIMLDNLTEQHAAQENMSLAELKEVIKAIYPSEDKFVLINFKIK